MAQALYDVASATLGRNHALLLSLTGAKSSQDLDGFALPLSNCGVSKASVCIHDQSDMWQFLEPALRSRLTSFSHPWGTRTLKNLQLDFVRMDSRQRFEPTALMATKVHHFLHLYLIKCEDLDTYRSTIKPRLRAWITELEGRGEEWLVVYIPLATASVQSNSTPRKIFDKLKSDFGSKCCRISLFDEPIKVDNKLLRKGNDTSKARPVTPPALMAARNAGDGEWGAFLYRFGVGLVKAFEERQQRVKAHLAILDVQRNNSDWTFSSYFIAAENLAFSSIQLGQLGDALSTYQELYGEYRECLAPQNEQNWEQGKHINVLGMKHLPLSNGDIPFTGKQSALDLRCCLHPDLYLAREEVYTRRISKLDFERYIFFRIQLLHLDLGMIQETTREALSFLPRMEKQRESFSEQCSQVERAAWTTYVAIELAAGISAATIRQLDKEIAESTSSPHRETEIAAVNPSPAQVRQLGQSGIELLDFANTQLQRLFSYVLPPLSDFNGSSDRQTGWIDGSIPGYLVSLLPRLLHEDVEWASSPRSEQLQVGRTVPNGLRVACSRRRDAVALFDVMMLALNEHYTAANRTRYGCRLKIVHAVALCTIEDWSGAIRVAKDARKCWVDRYNTPSIYSKQIDGDPMRLRYCPILGNWEVIGQDTSALLLYAMWKGQRWSEVMRLAYQLLGPKSHLTLGPELKQFVNCVFQEAIECGNSTIKALQLCSDTAISFQGFAAFNGDFLIGDRPCVSISLHSHFESSIVLSDIVLKFSTMVRNNNTMPLAAETTIHESIENDTDGDTVIGSVTSDDEDDESFPAEPQDPVPRPPHTLIPEASHASTLVLRADKKHDQICLVPGENIVRCQATEIASEIGAFHLHQVEVQLVHGTKAVAHDVDNKSTCLVVEAPPSNLRIKMVQPSLLFPGPLVQKIQVHIQLEKDHPSCSNSFVNNHDDWSPTVMTSGHATFKLNKVSGYPCLNLHHAVLLNHDNVAPSLVTEENKVDVQLPSISTKDCLVVELQCTWQQNDFRHMNNPIFIKEALSVQVGFTRLASENDQGHQVTAFEIKHQEQFDVAIGSPLDFKMKTDCVGSANSTIRACLCASVTNTSEYAVTLSGLEIVEYDQEADGTRQWTAVNDCMSEVELEPGSTNFIAFERFIVTTLSPFITKGKLVVNCKTSSCTRVAQPISSSPQPTDGEGHVSDVNTFTQVDQEASMVVPWELEMVARNKCQLLNVEYTNSEPRIGEVVDVRYTLQVPDLSNQPTWCQIHNSSEWLVLGCIENAPGFVESGTGKQKAVVQRRLTPLRVGVVSFPEIVVKHTSGQQYVVDCSQTVVVGQAAAMVAEFLAHQGVGK